MQKRLTRWSDWPPRWPRPAWLDHRYQHKNRPRKWRSVRSRRHLACSRPQRYRIASRRTHRTIWMRQPSRRNRRRSQARRLTCRQQSLMPNASRPKIRLRRRLNMRRCGRLLWPVSAARSLTDQGTSRPRGIPPQSTRFESEIEAALSSPAELQEKRNDLELYLHFSGPNDRELVEELGEVLGEAGYEIAGIDRVGGKIITGDIRYRHQDQEEEVENIRTISEKYLEQNTARRRPNLKSVDIGKRYPNQPRDRIELWLPQLMH